MHLTIDEEQRLELRRALFERNENLEKLQKKVREAGLVEAERDIAYHLRLIKGGPGPEPGLLDLLSDPAEQEQGRLFEVPTPEQEEEMRREVRRALCDLLPSVEPGFYSDAELAAEIQDAWRDVGTDEELGVHIHTTLAGEIVRCFVSLEPAFWYAVPEDFDPLDHETWPPTLDRGALLELAHELLSLTAPAPAAEE